MKKLYGILLLLTLLLVANNMPVLADANTSSSNTGTQSTQPISIFDQPLPNGLQFFTSMSNYAYNHGNYHFKYDTSSTLYNTLNKLNAIDDSGYLINYYDLGNDVIGIYNKDKKLVGIMMPKIPKSWRDDLANYIDNSVMANQSYNFDHIFSFYYSYDNKYEKEQQCNELGEKLVKFITNNANANNFQISFNTSIKDESNRDFLNHKYKLGFIHNDRLFILAPVYYYDNYDNFQSDDFLFIFPLNIPQSQAPKNEW